MIGIPSELAPSSLLYDEQVSPNIQTLLEKSRTFRQRGEWEHARRCAADAENVCRDTGDQVGVALAQLHMADFYGDVGEIGQALDYCKKAYQILQGQSNRIHRHNKAVAAYAQGVLYERQPASDGMKAVRWYEEAVRQFLSAQIYWATVNGKSQFETCRRACQWIKDRSAQVVENRSDKYSWMPSFDIWQVDSLNSPFTRNGNNPQGHIERNRVIIDGIPYRAHPVPDQSSSIPQIDQKNYYFALPVPEDQWAIPGTQVGDYVFVRQQWTVDQENVGIVWEPGSGWVTVDFKDQKENRPDFGYTAPQVIGDASPTATDLAGKLKGCVVGLLKPEG